MNLYMFICCMRKRRGRVFYSFQLLISDRFRPPPAATFFAASNLLRGPSIRSKRCFTFPICVQFVFESCFGGIWGLHLCQFKASPFFCYSFQLSLFNGFQHFQLFKTLNVGNYKTTPCTFPTKHIAVSLTCFTEVEIYIYRVPGRQVNVTPVGPRFGLESLTFSHLALSILFNCARRYIWCATESL